MIINSRLSNNEIVDIDQQYDPRFFRNETFPDGTIPSHAVIGQYRRTPGGAIEQLTQNDLDQKFPLAKARADYLALKNSLTTDIGALPNGAQKQILADMMRFIIAVGKLARAE